jgi:hypothetical protein
MEGFGSLNSRRGWLSLRAASLLTTTAQNSVRILDVERWALLVDRSKYVTFQKDEILVQKGKQTRMVYLLVKGAAKVEAGIWEVEKQTTMNEPRFAIITTRANDLMRPIHLRMPVILRPEQESIWLSGKTPVPELLALLEPAPSKELWRVRGWRPWPERTSAHLRSLWRSIEQQQIRQRSWSPFGPVTPSSTGTQNAVIHGQKARAARLQRAWLSEG